VVSHEFLVVSKAENGNVKIENGKTPGLRLALSDFQFRFSKKLENRKRKKEIGNMRKRKWNLCLNFHFQISIF